MKTAAAGDRVQVHYVKRLEDGTVATSHKRGPIELTIGVKHPRLPGLDLALVGLAPGSTAKVQVPADRAYGASDAGRILRLARTRFPEESALAVGTRLSVLDKKGRHRQVRILEVRDDSVVVDANHRWAGQTLEMEVELVQICPPSQNAAPTK